MFYDMIPVYKWLVTVLFHLGGQKEALLQPKTDSVILNKKWGHLFCLLSIDEHIVRHETTGGTSE